MRSSSASSSSVERRVDRIRASLADRLLPPSSADSGASNDHTSNEQLSDTAVARLLAVEARRGKELSMVLGPKAFLMKHQEGIVRGGEPERKVGDLNKTFLQNTINSVESHNRREQVESAWRQHDLLKKLDRGDLLSSVPTPDADAEVVAEGGGGNSRRTRKRARSPGRSEGEARGNGDGSAPSAAAPASPCGSDCSAGSFTSSSSSAGDSRAAPLSHIRYGLSRQGADSSADMLSEREMWALRKAKAFGAVATSSSSDYASSSSLTEEGQIKEPKRAKKERKESHKKKSHKKEKKKEHKHKKSRSHS